MAARSYRWHSGGELGHGWDMGLGLAECTTNGDGRDGSFILRWDVWWKAKWKGCGLGSNNTNG